MLLCRHGTAVWLVLSEPCDAEIHAEIPLDPLQYRTGDHWHVRVDGLPDEFCYGYRVDGPDGNGHRYDPRIILLDPSPVRSRAAGPGGSGGLPRRSLMTRIDDRAATGRSIPRIPLEDTIIYELHVRGFTVDPSSGVRHPGTSPAWPRRSHYLKGLGVTAVELLPVDEFDENDCPFVNPLTGERLQELLGLQHDRLRRAEGRLREQSRAARSPGTSSAAWSTPSTPRASRSSSTSSSTTPPKGARTARPTTSAAWTTASTTCSTTTAAT